MRKTLQSLIQFNPEDMEAALGGLDTHEKHLTAHSTMIKALAESISKVAIELGDNRSEMLGRIYCLETELNSLSEVDIFVYRDNTPYGLVKENNEDACWDVFAAHDTIIPCGERGMVETGLVIAVDAHWEVMVRSRSSTSANTAKPRKLQKAIEHEDGRVTLETYTEAFPKYLTVHLGTGDPGYRKSYKVIVENAGPNDAFLRKGDKIGQIGIRLKPKTERVIYVDSIDDLPQMGTRGASGFGNSGSHA